MRASQNKSKLRQFSLFMIIFLVEFTMMSPSTSPSQGHLHHNPLIIPNWPFPGRYEGSFIFSFLECDSVEILLISITEVETLFNLGECWIRSGERQSRKLDILCFVPFRKGICFLELYWYRHVQHYIDQNGHSSSWYVNSTGVVKFEN